MSQAELIGQLVSAGLNGEIDRFRSIVTAMAARARANKHNRHASNLENALAQTERNARVAGLSPDCRRVPESTVPCCLELTPAVKFANLILPEHVVATCDELVREQKSRETLYNHNLWPRSRMLLIGPPGNGKTSLAEAVAEALQVPFYIVRYELLVGSYLGETSSRLQKLFERVASRHCVLFFDEFETLARERGSDNEVGEIKRVVSSLLMLIDRLPSHVVVIAASNHGKMLDYAVRRRFDVRIHLPAPDLAQVEKFLGEFERRTTVTFGMPVPEIAERIFRKLNNFAEIENFAVSVMRDYYLDNPAGGIRSIVERRIELADRCDIPDDCLAGRETPC